MPLNKEGFTLLELIIIIIISPILLQIIASIYHMLFISIDSSNRLEPLIELEIEIIRIFKRDKKLPYPKDIAENKKEPCQTYSGYIKEGVNYKIAGQPFCKELKNDQKIIEISNKQHEIFITKDQLLARSGLKESYMKCECNLEGLNKNIANYANRICKL